MLKTLSEEAGIPEGENEMPQSTVDKDPSLSLPTLHILIDRKGRKGKVATIIEGFDPDDKGIEEITSYLKKKIGTGGSSRGGEILLQGDWKEKAAEILKAKGYKIK